MSCCHSRAFAALNASSWLIDRDKILCGDAACCEGVPGGIVGACPAVVLTGVPSCGILHLFACTHCSNRLFSTFVGHPRFGGYDIARKVSLSASLYPARVERTNAHGGLLGGDVGGPPQASALA